MTKLKEDRFDVLISKAKAGDAQSQYELAHWFKNGYLVEVSNEQAAYWAFKALDNGYMDAESLLRSIEY